MPGPSSRVPWRISPRRWADRPKSFPASTRLGLGSRCARPCSMLILRALSEHLRATFFHVLPLWSYVPTRPNQVRRPREVAHMRMHQLFKRGGLGCRERETASSRRGASGHQPGSPRSHSAPGPAPHAREDSWHLDQAAQIQDSHYGWVVIWGTWRRAFSAFCCFAPVPYVVDAADATELIEGMDAVVRHARARAAQKDVIAERRESRVRPKSGRRRGSCPRVPASLASPIARSSSRRPR